MGGMVPGQSLKGVIFTEPNAPSRRRHVGGESRFRRMVEKFFHPFTFFEFQLMVVAVFFLVLLAFSINQHYNKGGYDVSADLASTGSYNGCPF